MLSNNQGLLVEGAEIVMQGPNTSNGHPLIRKLDEAYVKMNLKLFPVMISRSQKYEQVWGMLFGDAVTSDWSFEISKNNND